jgi:serine/threonine protein kinase
VDCRHLVVLKCRVILKITIVILKMTIIINMWYMSLIGRDTKPGNILLDKDGHCKMGDFRLAALGIVKGKKARGYCGTELYMASEVIVGLNCTWLLR